MTVNDALLGTLLDNRYLVEERIAVGGMATVYRGTDTRLDRVVALKVMHPQFAGDPEFAERFIREAKAVAKLSHPNVVNVFDQNADGGTAFLAMEYVPGRTLREVLADRGAFSVRAALDVLEPVLAALGAAHRAQLVHRDVKPENVLITDGGLVKVADFGLVRVISGDSAVTTASTPGVIMGTVSYLAPEQIQSDGPTDQRVDVYAAGILLYELLTGSKPFTGENPMQVIYRHLEEDVPPPSRAVPGLAPELDSIVASATARDRAARPWDAVELLAALQRLRRTLTPAQLDAEPPASTRAPRFGAAEATSVLPPAADNPTAVLTPVRAGRGREDRLLPLRPYDEPPPEPRLPRPARLGRSGGRARRTAVWGAVLAALVAVVATTTYLLSGAVYGTVPSVLGQTQAQAASTLGGAGLHAAFSQAFSETVPAGQVISSDPGVGQKVRKNDPVKVVVSKGPERIPVPDLVGKPLDQAKQLLTAAHLTPGDTSQDYSATVPAGSVVSSNPAAGQQLAASTPVSLVVSKGPQPVQVPNVVGQSADQAQAALTAAGFQATLGGDQAYSDTVPAGSVAAQSPTGLAAPGSSVSLTLSKGPQPVAVPNVTGMSESDATNALTAAGFKVRSTGLNFFGLSSVSDQSPKAGSTAPRGSTVTIKF